MSKSRLEWFRRRWNLRYSTRTTTSFLTLPAKAG